MIQLLIDGYIREFETSLNDKIIAKDINSICFKFYFIEFILDSVILTEAEKAKLYELFIERKMKEKTVWKLLYRRSEDGESSEVCHKKCRNNANILWIVQSETNNVFGGFTTRTWIRSGRLKHDDHAFLYLLRSNKDYPAKSFAVKSNKSQCAVAFKINRLCTFGKYDLVVTGRKVVNARKGGIIYNTPSEGYLNGDKLMSTLLDLEIFSCSK